MPHFADADKNTLGIDAHKLGAYLRDITERPGESCRNRLTGRRIRAVVPMHTFGYPADLSGFSEVCRRFGLVLIEDAAEALGSRNCGSHVGSAGLSAVLSFNGNKIVTCDGGALLTNDAALAEAAKHLTTTARLSPKWEFVHDAVAYNYRLPNLNAALGLAQLEQIEDFPSRKRALAARYGREPADCAGVRMFEPPPFAQSNHWLNALIFEQDDLSLRDRVLETLNANGVGARPVWRLMHRLPMFRDCPRMLLSTAESLERRIVNIPGSALLAAAKF